VIDNLYWTAFAPKTLISEKIELHVCHPTAGIIQVIENEEKKFFFNNEKVSVNGPKLPNIRNIKYISNLSPNKKYVAYLSA